MNKLLHPLYGYPTAAWDFLCALADNLRLLGTDHRPLEAFTIGDDFFGVNVAPGDAPATDDYILERLAELGIGQVRMDFSYGSPGSQAERLLQRLLQAGIDVTLDLLPPMAEAQLLYHDPEAQHRWQRFLTDVLQQYAGTVARFEIGNTPNRGKWSGFSSRSFITALDIARQVTSQVQPQVCLVGPNVSDFEPLYNASYLRLMRRLGAVPVIHSDNLFVERVVEPEAYDHRVLGWLLREPLKLNLIKKARMLNRMGRRVGAGGFYCTYTCWTIKRLRRRSAWPEQKRVDYLVRYLVLAASSGELDRVYWGPLVCSRDGLIDDGADDYPIVDQVSFYERIRGEAADFVPTAAYRALAHTTSRLRGARCLGARHDPAGLSLFHFQCRDDKQCLLVWTRDAQAWPLQQLLPAQLLETARFMDTFGEAVQAPLVATEHPLFIELSTPFDVAMCQDVATSRISKVVHLSSPTHQSLPFNDTNWHGAVMLRDASAASPQAASRGLHPSDIAAAAETRVLRDARNRLWNIADPSAAESEITVKLNRVKGFKRLTYRFYPSKGRRHWNNACDMLRRDINTPLPLAFFEAPKSPGVRDSWYLCQFIPNAFSCRDVYAGLRNGGGEFAGLSSQRWFDLIAGFVCHMHDMQVIHRDLSSGNLMFTQADDGAVTPMVIDIGRARIWSGPGSRVRQRDRMLDLIRIAYKLDWHDRTRFMECYEEHHGKALSPLWRIPFWYYDQKQSWKKALKGKRKRSRQ
ncbi:hypothetical protein F0M18_05875 [Pseudohalioglobus sediminis]|uniref:Protein kinase domain-containing protein n=1 Tax=Pseudohalioglobus sediminis TaxID=2606449 RepID=A0A5B0X1W3_9GAMM|nr:lipopolysaccharide kinase InaA family protein [Pseudohalioglobus sediminis]KAA1193364.1 hypothetical protein F0M18_05875 [Pseudohalioglobus sediminis]